MPLISATLCPKVKHLAWLVNVVCFDCSVCLRSFVCREFGFLAWLSDSCLICLPFFDGPFFSMFLFSIGTLEELFSTENLDIGLYYQPGGLSAELNLKNAIAGIEQIVSSQLILF